MGMVPTDGADMSGSKKGGRMFAFVLFVVAFVLMVTAAAIDFAKEGGSLSSYLTLVAAGLLAVAVASSFAWWRSSA